MGRNIGSMRAVQKCMEWDPHGSDRPDIRHAPPALDADINFNSF